MSGDLKKIVEEISQLTLLEAAEIVKMLEETLGVSAAAMSVAAPVAAAGAQEAAPEKTDFAVELTGIEDPSKKLGVIKVVRELTSLGLGEAKAAVEAAPKVLKDGLNKETANEWKQKLEAVGAKITLK